MATAWVETNYIDENIKLTNGLLEGVEASTDFNEMTALFKELFDFQHVGLYRGIRQKEAYFEVSKSGMKMKIFETISLKYFANFL